MKLKVYDPFEDEGSSSEEPEVPSASVNGNGLPKKSSLKLEVKEHKTRFSLKGEPVEKVVEAEDDEAGDKESEGCAMNSYKTYNERGKLFSSRLEIYSPFINQALGEVIKSYPGVSIQKGTSILYGELRCIFHYRHELDQYRKNLKDGIAKLHLDLLMRFMRRELKRELRAYESNVETTTAPPSIEFQDLWMIFKPGELVITGRDLKEQVMMLTSTALTYCEPQEWSIVGQFFTHDGRKFGGQKKSIEVKKFEGTKEIWKLNIFPLMYHEHEQAIRQKHIARGKRFCDMHGVHHKYYRGTAMALSHEFDRNQYGQLDSYALETMTINSRIMVDAKAFGAAKSGNQVLITESKVLPPDCKDERAALTDHEFMTCDFVIPGFALSEKRWCWFFIDLIKPIEFNADAFQSLLLPQKHKQLLHALVDSHGTEEFDDLIRNKGRGMIFVLYGIPGVGKTFTVESIADHTKRPLYTLNSGELGITPESVETNLTAALALAAKWGAVLLIDEADVFLEQRSIHDLTRNCLVSLFLRVLEYYQGIMFLTTNRLETFDPAFKSRIHLALKYSALEEAHRKKLWKLFIDQASKTLRPQSIPDEVLDEFSKVPLNGRQIKNAVRTAIILATKNGVPLGREQIDIVLETIRDFEEDING